MPDVSVSAVLLDAPHDLLDGVDLVRPHHEKSLLVLDENHVPADHVAERAFGKELLGEVVEVRDLLVVWVGELVDGQVPLVGVEREVPLIVVGEVVGFVAVAHDEELKEAEERSGVAVAGVVLVRDNLLHCFFGVDAKRLQLDLHDGDAVEQEENVVAVALVIGVDSDLVYDFKVVLAPVFQVHERVIERGSVVADESVDLAQDLCSGKDVGSDDFFEQSVEFGVGKVDAVEFLELLAEVLLQALAFSNIRTKSYTLAL